jgi:VWFA-related protein
MPFVARADHHDVTLAAYFRTLSTQIVFLLIVAVTGLPLLAQQDDQSVTTIKKDVNVVNVLATVRNKQGQIISTLSKEDFQLEVDGKPQIIRYFSRVTDTPLTLGLLVDTSYSQRRLLEKERTASYTFLNDLLNESRDKAFVIHFDFDIELLQDLTSSRPRLQAALQRLEVSEAQQVQTSGSPDPGQGGRGGGTKLYDSVFLACDEIAAKQQGRKAIIILSDGVDQGSKVGMMRAIEAAQRSNTLVYTILFADKGAYNNIARGYPGGHGGGQQGGGYPGGGYPGGGYPGGGYPGGGRQGGGYPGGGYPGGGYPSGGNPGGGQGGGYPGGGGGGNRPGGGGRGGNYPHEDGKRVMQQLAQQTGGRFFEVSKHDSIDNIYKSIGDELRNQYSLGFTPDPAQPDGEFHKINVTTTQNDMTVQAREGYYSGKQP